MIDELREDDMNDKKKEMEELIHRALYKNKNLHPS